MSFSRHSFGSVQTNVMVNSSQGNTPKQKVECRRKPPRDLPTLLAALCYGIKSRMNQRQAEARNRQRRPVIGLRHLSLILPCMWAFVLNDVTTIESSKLSSFEMTTDAMLLSLTPLLLLIIWAFSFMYWLYTPRSVLNWVLRLVGLWIVSMALFSCICLFTSRNLGTVTVTDSVSEIPPPATMGKIEEKLGLTLTWSGDQNGLHILYDKRELAANGKTKSQIIEMLAELQPKITD